MKKAPFVPKNGIEEQFLFLCSIPHPSGGEAELARAILEKARDKGLEARVDQIGNVLIKKNASAGMENAPAVILQAHLDMVCSKEDGCRIDFERDPIRPYVDEKGWLRAEGTSLGADDGYGVAYMLDILLNEGGPAHPALECLFTVEEEIGLLGAKAFDCASLRGRRLISLDSEGETQAVVSTAGGERLTARMTLGQARVQGTRWEIGIAGLTGGHSAEAIHLGRANALKVLARLLSRAAELPGAALISLEGGEAPNVIPRSAQAEICLPDGADEAALQALARRYERLYAVSDPGMRVRVEALGAFEGQACAPDGAHLMALWPNGVCYMDPTRPGVVEASANLGVARLEQGTLTLRAMLRSIGEDWQDEMEQRMRLTAARFGAVCQVDSVYPGMRYQQQSALRDAYESIIQADTGRALTQRATHGGMEVGYFAKRIPQVDILCLGCDAVGAHSPSEALDLGSFARAYDRMRRLLSSLT